MTVSEAKKSILSVIISAQISTYMCTYAPDYAVITISNIIELIDGLTLYRARQALKSLISDGLVVYASQGRPAVVSCGECPELIFEAMPPINGYKLTKAGFSSEEYKDAYKDWCKSLEESANVTI